MIYNLHKLEDMKPCADVLKEDPPYAVFLSTIHNISMPRIAINDKIVVVGGSATGRSFLMALVSKQNYKYKLTLNNLTLVTPHTINMQTEEITDQIFMKQNSLTARCVSLYSFDTYVNIIYGTMTAIDRKEKKIIVNRTDYLHYDYLILTVGDQYQMPQLPNYNKDTKTSDQPKNIYIINTHTDAKYAINDVKKYSNKEGEDVVHLNN